MPQLADVVTFSKRKESRKERVIPWADFEPLLSQLRQAADCNQEEAMRLIGYGGGTMINTWKKEGAPILAVNALRYILADLNVPQEKKVEKQFSFDELTALFAALQGWHVEDDVKRALTKKIAREM